MRSKIKQSVLLSVFVAFAMIGCSDDGAKSDGVADLPAAIPANITITASTLTKIIRSTYDTDYTPSIDINGTIDSNGLRVNVPYTVVNEATTLPAYSRRFTILASSTEDGESGIIATFAWEEQSNLPVGSGTFPATVKIDDSNANTPNGVYYAKKLDTQDDWTGITAATFKYPTDNSGGTGILSLKVYPISPLLKTGQTISHEAYDDGSYKKGAARSYTSNGSTVTDNTTDLIWQDNQVASSETYDDAITQCSNLSLAGKTDWRLPTRKELRTLLDYGKYSSAIDTVFQNTRVSHYWSSTIYVVRPDDENSTYDVERAWIISFWIGHQDNAKKTSSYPVRCVRAGK